MGSVQGEKEKDWVVNMEKLVKEEGDAAAAEAEEWLKQSIYRVPSHIRNTSASLPYGPNLVSLGPFHHGNPEVAAMEAHKQRALLHLLRRTGRPLKELVASLTEVEQKLQDAYKDLDGKWREQDDRDCFLKMMLLDGCFLLEVMDMDTAEAAEEQEGECKLRGYAANDPIFSRHGQVYVFPYIRRDMLVIENQLPLLVLQRLVAFLYYNDPAKHTDDAINDKVLKFVTMTPEPAAITGGGLALHPLDVCHRSLLYGPRQPPCTGLPDEFLPSATELDQAGVHFKPSQTRSLHDIWFDRRRGVLRIPLFTVEDTTEHKLMSLMAFEQLHQHAAGRRLANEVTGYVFFMDNLIKSAADARLLSGSGVLENGLGSDVAMADMFNRLANEAVLEPRSHLHDVHRAVNAYKKTRWHTWRASLVQNHAGNPWAIISLVAAVFLLVLTVVQTVYTLLPYYDQY